MYVRVRNRKTRSRTPHDERASDSELVELCTRGTARDSADFRSLCLKKQSELAARLIPEFRTWNLGNWPSPACKDVLLDRARADKPELRRESDIDAQEAHL